MRRRAIHGRWSPTEPKSWLLGIVRNACPECDRAVSLTFGKALYGVAEPSLCNAMPQLALYQPDIPQNAGTMFRLCACLGVEAAVVEPASFPVSDRHFRRAGLDYLDSLTLARHVSFAAFEAWRASVGRRLVLLTTGGATDYRDFAFRPDDILMVGRESAGVPAEVHAAADARLRVVMAPGMRSLTVAGAAARVRGEALRQVGRTG